MENCINIIYLLSCVIIYPIMFIFVCLAHKYDARNGKIYFLDYIGSGLIAALLTIIWPLFLVGIIIFFLFKLTYNKFSQPFENFLDKVLEIYKKL